MAELILRGWLTQDDGVALSPQKERGWGNVIAEDVAKFLNGTWYEEGLGRRRAIHPQCRLRIWYSNFDGTLEEVMEQFDMKLYGGEVESEYHQTGYSEYTITGIDIDTFSIGGHDLERELTSHIGEFCHFILETDV